MIRRPPRSTLDRSSAASDVYKRQLRISQFVQKQLGLPDEKVWNNIQKYGNTTAASIPVSYTHLRAHETVLDLVCRLLLEKKNLHAMTH